jgi:hypothetical protein
MSNSVVVRSFQTLIALCALGGVRQSSAQAIVGGSDQVIASPSTVEFLRAVAIPGDGDVGYRLTHEFVYCESPACTLPGRVGCERQPFLCVPDSWCKAEIARNFDDGERGRFLRDARTLKDGSDTDPQNGMEVGHLSFYGGHGTSASMTVFPDPKDVFLRDTSLGDLRTRYWWMFSCNVMAHGPICTTPNSDRRKPQCRGGLSLTTASDFLAPQDFQKDDDNAFAGWGKPESGPSPRIPLNANLRMACGGSTRLGGYSSFPTASIWHYKLMTQLAVADSFLLGLARGYQVPLCMTRGWAEAEATPLYDQDFTPDKNAAPDGDHLFMEYPVHLDPPFAEVEDVIANEGGFAGSPPRSDRAQGPPPALPVLDLEPTPLPEWLGKLVPDRLPRLSYGYRGGGADLLFAAAEEKFHELLPPWLRDPGVLPGDVCLKIQPQSGAVTIAWIPQGDAAGDAAPIAVREHLLSSVDLASVLASVGLAGEQWIGPAAGIRDVERLLPEIEVLKMNVDGAKTARAISTDFAPSDIDRRTKCLFIRLKPWLKVNGTPVPVFDEGGEWLIGGCPRRLGAPAEASKPDNTCLRQLPAQLNLSWVGRKVKGEEKGTVISLRDARKEAQKRLGSRRRKYREASYRWGYKAAPVHCKQSRMYLVYRFDFLPRDRGDLAVTIEIAAHRLPPGKLPEDDWTCDPEVPAKVK